MYCYRCVLQIPITSHHITTHTPSHLIASHHHTHPISSHHITTHIKSHTYTYHTLNTEYSTCVTADVCCPPSPASHSRLEVIPGIGENGEWRERERSRGRKKRVEKKGEEERMEIRIEYDLFEFIKIELFKMYSIVSTRAEKNGAGSIKLK
jgi:hypothetical protein